jgi:hypothetical protein
MSAGVFRKKIYQLMQKAGFCGSEVDIRFMDGKFIAVFPDGTKITGNRLCDSVRVDWGSGHSAIARI